MLVFWDQRLVVLPTPKTGSTSLMVALAPLSSISIRRPPMLRHVTVQRYHMHVRPWLEDTAQAKFRVVAMMREPTSWLGSWYRYRQRPKAAAAKSTRDMSFDEFVTAWCRDERPSFADVGSQERFLRPTKAKKWLDRLFRYEEMDDFITFLQAELGETIALETHNASPPGKLSLSPETERLLREVGTHDFHMYETLQPSRTL